MTADDVRRIIAFLGERVRFAGSEQTEIAFELPTEAEMRDAGLHPDGIQQLLDAPWRDEMVTDVVETPEMCDPGEAPEIVLGYAKDVVSEYVSKRIRP